MTGQSPSCAAAGKRSCGIICLPVFRAIRRRSRRLPNVTLTNRRAFRIAQMRWLAGQVRERGGKALDPWDYKDAFNARLMERVLERKALRTRKPILCPAAGAFLRRCGRRTSRCFLPAAQTMPMSARRLRRCKWTAFSMKLPVRRTAQTAAPRRRRCAGCSIRFI